MRPTDKYNILLHWLENLGNVAIAFSGGVDSTFLLAMAKKALNNKVLAITVKASYIPNREILEAQQFCKVNNILHYIIEADFIPEIRNNPENRCYLCKHHIFSLLKTECSKRGFNHLLDGTNADDQNTFRPGMAALTELGIKSPLLEQGFSKDAIRRYSAKMGLPTASKASYACLLSRMPYNTEITVDELTRVEKAEQYLFSLGYANSRVRSHGIIARIELEKEKVRNFVRSKEAIKLVPVFKALGYHFVTLDLEGYRSGSFDKAINHEYHEPGLSE